MLLSCSWEKKVISYISKINRNIYRFWKFDPIFWSNLIECFFTFLSKNFFTNLMVYNNFFQFLNYLIQRSFTHLINQKKFNSIYPVFIQKLKQPLITVKVITENRAYWGFQEWPQIKKMATSLEQSTHIISCIT